jgi:hypothetical protein
LVMAAAGAGDATASRTRTAQESADDLAGILITCCSPANLGVAKLGGGGQLISRWLSALQAPAGRAGFIRRSSC